MNMQEYLGDSVYAHFDGDTIILYLDNGEGPFNTIVLEPEVLKALDAFRIRVEEEKAHQKTES